MSGRERREGSRRPCRYAACAGIWGALPFSEIQHKLGGGVACAQGKQEATAEKLRGAYAVHNAQQRAQGGNGKADCGDQMQMLLLKQNGLGFFRCGLDGGDIAVALVIVVEQIIGGHGKQPADL